MLAQLTAIIILDSDGNRLAAKYYSLSHALGSSTSLVGTAHQSNPSPASHIDQHAGVITKPLPNDVQSQFKFESLLFAKSSKFNNKNDFEVMLVSQYICLFRASNDTIVFVVGDSADNELVLLDVIQAIHQCLSTITNGQVARRQVLENLDEVFIMLDEVVDEGLIFETDPNVICSRLNMRPQAEPPHESTAFNQAFHNAKENIMRSLLSGSS